MSEDTDPIVAAATDDEMDAAIRGRSLEDVVRVANNGDLNISVLVLRAIERRMARRKERREGRTTPAEEPADES